MENTEKKTRLQTAGKGQKQTQQLQQEMQSGTNPLYQREIQKRNSKRRNRKVDKRILTIYENRMEILKDDTGI